MANKFLLYAMVISVPLSLGGAAFQSARFYTLEKQVKELNEEQQKTVEANKRIITDIALLSSSARIEKIAKDNLGLDKIQPENTLTIIIDK